MTDGEELYHLLCLSATALGSYPNMPLWSTLGSREELTWEDTARAFRLKLESAILANLGVPAQWQSVKPQFIANPVPAVPTEQRFKTLLQKYGRHAPSCIPGAPCTCGYAEIEREL